MVIMIKKAFSLITIEPSVFLRAVGLYIVIGSAIRSELLLQKICRKDLGYNATICENLEDDENEDIENQGSKSQHFRAPASLYRNERALMQSRGASTTLR